MAEKMKDLDEILDDLDLEVPTAAYKYKVKIESEIFTETSVSYPKIGGWKLNNVNRVEGSIEKLVTREDYREALREAVQHGMEQERRRIQDKIRDRVDNLRTSNLRPVEVSVIKDKLEELEEEVETSESRPKTGKSDNFGKTDNNR